MALTSRIQWLGRSLSGALLVATGVSYLFGGVTPAAAVSVGWVSANAGAPTNQLAISCIASTTDCWSVGGSGGTGSFYASTDSGLDWTNLTANLPSAGSPSGPPSKVTSLACTAVAGSDDCWAVASYSGATLVIFSANGGATFQAIATVPGTLNATSSVSCAASTTNCFVTESGPEVATTTNGTTWNLVTGSFPSSPLAVTGLSAISCPTSQTCFAIGQTATVPVVVATSNAGAAWSEESLPFYPAGLTASSIACPTANNCYVVGTSNGQSAVAATTDGGLEWVPEAVPQVGTLVSVSCPAPSACVATGPGAGGVDAVLATSDGQIWYSQSEPPVGADAVACTTSTSCTSAGTTGVDVTSDFGETLPAPSATVVAYPGNGSATVAWSPSPSGGPVTSYTITPSPACASCTGLSVPGTAVFSVVSGLTNGQAYTFKVTATDGAGSGAPSVASAAVTPQAPPVGGASAWNQVLGSESLDGVTCPSASLCLAVGQANPASPAAGGAIVSSTNTGGSWTLDPAPSGSTVLTAAACASTTLCFAVGSSYNALTGQSSAVVDATGNGGSTWTQDQVPAGVASLQGVGCATATNCVAVGQYLSGAAAVVVTQDGGSSWFAPVLPSGTANLASVSCSYSAGPPVSEPCLAVGAVASGGSVPTVLVSADQGFLWSLVSAGNIPAVQTAGQGLASVSCPTPSHCYAVGPGYSSAAGTSALVSTNGGASWSSEAVSASSQPLGSISCVESSGDDCWSVGSGGAIWATSGGATWSPQASGLAAPLAAVACLSASSCVAVGNLAAGVPVTLSTANGGVSWSASASGLQAGVGALACSGSGSCVAVGSPFSDEVSTNGGATWSPSTLPASVSYLYAVSCPSQTTCFAAGISGGNGAVLASSNGGSSWVAQSLPGGVTALYSVACPSQTTCFAAGTGAGGAALVATTNGGSNWSQQSLPAGVSGLSSVACISVSTCFAAGKASGAAAFISTTNGGSTWTAANDSSATSFASIACASSSNCVAAGSNAGSPVVAVTTNGGGSWSAASLPAGTGTAVLASAACASSGVCMVGGYVQVGSLPSGGPIDQGLVLASSNPFASGGGTWTAGVLPASSANASSLTCPSAGDCLAAGGGIAQSTTSGVSVPGAPTIGTATVSGTSATVTWTAPASNGGGAITGYVVSPNPSCPACGGLSASGSATSTTVTGLSVGVSYTFTVQAQNSAGLGPASAASNAVVASPVTITTTSLPNGVPGQPYSASLQASGGTAPYTWSVASGSLPAGLSLSSGGVISGTPTSAGTSTFTVKATDSSASPGPYSATQQLTITVPLSSLVITTSSLPTGVLTQAYSATLQAQGGTPPYSWSVPSGKLPAGLSLAASTGAISGTPTALGTFSVIFQVTDSSSPPQSATVTIPITVVSNVLTALQVPLPQARAGAPYSFSLPVQGGVPPYRWSLASGALPSGLVVSPAGVISGTPSIPLTASFTLTVTDSESPTPATGSVALTMVVRPPASTQAYWEVAADGGVFTFAAANEGWSPGFHGSAGGLPLAAPVVGIAPTPDGLGYWEVAADGGVFSFGDAGFFGSMAGLPLAAPVVGIAPTPDGLGYWEVAADGGVFSFGDAAFYGSRGGFPFAPAMVSMASTPDGHGYWLVASNGGVFCFGDAGFFGSAGGMHLQAPVVGFSPTPDGGGYWLVGSDGGVFSFGDAAFAGSLGGKALAAPVVGIASSLDGGGYWLVTSDGRVFNFGDAAYVGSMGGVVLAAPVVGVVAP